MSFVLHVLRICSLDNRVVDQFEKIVVDKNKQDRNEEVRTSKEKTVLS